MTKLNNKVSATQLQGRAFKPLLNTDSDLEELHEKVVWVTNETTEDLVGYKNRKVIKVSEATPVL